MWHLHNNQMCRSKFMTIFTDNNFKVVETLVEHDKWKQWTPYNMSKFYRYPHTLECPGIRVFPTRLLPQVHLQIGSPEWPPGATNPWSETCGPCPLVHSCRKCIGGSLSHIAVFHWQFYYYPALNRSIAMDHYWTKEMHLLDYVSTQQELWRPTRQWILNLKEWEAPKNSYFIQCLWVHNLFRTSIYKNRVVGDTIGKEGSMYCSIGV